MATLKEAKARPTLQIELEARWEVECPISVDPGRSFRISVDLSPESLISLLCELSNLFTWKPADMPRIDPATICHRLAIDLAAKLVIEKRCSMGLECQEAVKEEVTCLLAANFIKKVHVHT